MNKKLYQRTKQLLANDVRMESILTSVLENFHNKKKNRAAMICNLTIELHELLVDTNLPEKDLLLEVAPTINYEELAALAEHYYEQLIK